MTIFQSLGFLRISLLALGVINSFLSPEPGTPINHEGLEVITTLVAPAAAPIIIMVILFDVLMSKIRASDSSGEESKKIQNYYVDRISSGCLYDNGLATLLLSYWKIT